MRNPKKTPQTDSANIKPPSSPPVFNPKAIDEMVHQHISKAAMGFSPISLALAYVDWAMHLAVSPGRQMELAQKAVELMQNELKQVAKSDKNEPVVPEKDPRFSAPAWSQWPFNVMKGGFKASDAWLQDATKVDGMSEHRQEMVSFFSRQLLDAWSPSNWPVTNPEVLTQSVETSGKSLMQGYQLFMKDLQQARISSNVANPKNLSPLPLTVGRDVAITLGKVVFRNNLIELIQYQPTTKKVAAEPILIIPSTIMKYYILDLSPHNSMVRYLIEQGFTVFMISWRNPDADDRHLGMDDYLQTGVMDAMRQVRKIADAPKIHTMGYCLGGTFLAIVAALLGSKEFLKQEVKTDHKKTLPLPELASVTLLAAQTDFSEAGELDIFIDDDQLKTLREQISRKGYLSGRQMAATFQFLHARDLIWSRNTRRYLLGEEETSNDLMSWNADTTRLPERMHSEYLDTLFLNDDLSEGHYQVSGNPVALMNLKMPLMVVGTVRDHVSPWKSVYKIHLYTDTDTTFILASGGHNAGIVSEPGHAKRNYQLHRMPQGHDWIDADDWLEIAAHHEGSWWEAWNTWLKEQSSQQIPAREIDAKASLCDAPGEYIMVRYAD